MVLAASSCVRFCIETFRVYFSYPTKTVISTSSAGIKSPDITICNHNGFDAAVLKSLTEYLYAAENKTANDSKADDWQYASEKFEKSVINLYNKYELFLKNYAENKQFSLEIQEQIKQLKSLFDKYKISSFMTNDEILDGTVPIWQILVWCKYGKLHEIIVTLVSINYIKASFSS